MSPTLPPFVPFPEAPWRDRIVPEEWEACLSAWLALSEAYLSLAGAEFERLALKDESVAIFLASLVREAAEHGTTTVVGESQPALSLLRRCYSLTKRLFQTSDPPPPLLQWEFLSDFSRVYGKARTSAVISDIFHNKLVDTSLQAVKKSLIFALDSGAKGDLKSLESRLKRLNHLIHASPDTAAFFLAGSDFLDGLISCYKVTNLSLRKTIVTTAYLCLVGLTEGPAPKFSILSDQLYSLKAAADSHKSSSPNVDDSMVAELVTVTPILKQVRHRAEQSGSNNKRIESFVNGLEKHRKPGGNIRPKRLVKRKIDKGKSIMTEDQDEIGPQMRMHHMSQISQIQDLFPDLGSGFISRLLDEYEDNTEQVVAHLLEDSLPPHLATIDRTKELSPERTRRKSHDIAPRPTPPQLPTRHNAFDDDDFDNLAVDVANLHFGKRNPGRTADDLLKDRSAAPNKAAILSALSAFDADDDERDDTYDAADAGFVINDGNPEEEESAANEEALFRAYQASPGAFGRDAATRRADARARLKQATGMTDEAIEGWAVMLARSPRQMRRLEAKYSAFSGEQPVLASTAWRGATGTGAAAEEDEEVDGPGGSGGGSGGGGNSNFRGGGNNRGRGGGGRGRGGRGGGRGGRGGGGNVAGPAGDRDTENARRHKEANKGSRANHNRRDQRAKKMSRGGFPG
ncbi:hypothetical protein F4809DRAFT_353446 [Biscogniauxia mediterranea]|nr:hypothetical protein F4809DRAFT_353446 [Biscogniauxia mediterranea]